MLWKIWTVTHRFGGLYIHPKEIIILGNGEDFDQDVLDQEEEKTFELILISEVSG